jgi:cysteine desulfurase/selenocysteine lyase
MNPSLDVDRLRADTLGCTEVAHLNNCASALPPAPVNEAVIAHLRLEERIGGYEAKAAADESLERARASVATLVGAHPDQIAFQESATAAWDRALLAITYTRPLREGERLLVSSAEYASNVLPLMQLCRSTGAVLEFVPDDPHGCVDVAALADMLDEKVALVAITHCPSQNGLINDVTAIGALLRESDAWYVVDACQSVGQMPVDAAAIGADFLSATGRKFLRGPRGTGFLYASDRALAELEPFPLDLVSATWLSDGYEVQSSARRYEYFERYFAGVLGLGAAVDYALDCGLDRIAERIALLAGHARNGLRAIPGVAVHDRGVRHSGIVTFTKDGISPVDTVAAVRATGVNVSMSGPITARYDFDRNGLTGVVRVSPHAYNTIEEIDRMLAAVADA